MDRTLIGAAAWAFAGWLAAVPAAAQPVYGVDKTAPVDDALGLRVPSGFTAQVFADGLGRARHLAVAPNGDVYVNLRSVDSDGRGVVALRDTDGDGAADVEERFSDIAGTGIALRGEALYVSSNDAVFRFDRPAGTLVPTGDPVTIVSGFPEQRAHAAKPIAFDGAGHLLVEVGVPSNACQEKIRTAGSMGRRPCDELERAGIWRFDAQAPGQDQMKDGVQVARGLRHAVAIDWHGAADALFFVQHGRDQLSSLWPDYFDETDNAEMPAEEFHIVEGETVREYGWPYTFFDPRADVRLVAPEYGGNGRENAEEGRYPHPLIAFPAHWAPNDLLFHSGTGLPEGMAGGAFIAFHGSWNRAPRPQGGYQVVFAPFGEDHRPTGDWVSFADGFPNEDPLKSPRDARYRPTGLAEGPDGALFISDSVTGRIWKVTYDG
ncbi:MAG: PQQ-dependent sugar dehydrogenase [Alphaproteobacteria bacterium]